MITQEQKLRIAARAFYNDNQDQYEDYREAVIEIGKTSPDFINFTFEANTPKREGYVLLEKEGNLIHVSNETGHVLPCSDLDVEFGEALRDESQEVAEQNPGERDLVKLFAKIGWAEVKQ